MISARPAPPARHALDGPVHDLMNQVSVALLSAGLLQKRLAAEGRDQQVASVLLDALAGIHRTAEALRVQVRLEQGPLRAEPIPLDALLDEALSVSGGRPGPQLPRARGLEVLGERAVTVQLFAALLGGAPPDAHRALRVRAVKDRVEFELAAPDDASALALAERLVHAHGGSWTPQPGRVVFSLPGSVST